MIILNSQYQHNLPRFPSTIKMSSKDIISMDQSREIIETFFKVNFKFKKLLQVHKSNHKDTQIIQHVKKVFIDMILAIQRELMLANKIKTMQIFQNKSDQMFNHLMNLQQILNEDHVSDFTIYYRNRVTRLTVYQTDLIPSQKRLSIYTAFINYAIDHDLFRFNLLQNPPQQISTFQSLYQNPLQLIQDPMTIYNQKVLLELYDLYCRFDGNICAIEGRVKREGKYKCEKYQGVMLEKNIKNILIIGLYRMYRAAMRRNVRPCCGWQSFVRKYDLEQMKLLFRVAIYDDAKYNQIMIISKAIKRRLIPQTGIQSTRVSEHKVSKQSFMKTIRDEMKNILTNSSKLEP